MKQIIGNVEIYYNEKTFERHILIDGIGLPKEADVTIWLDHDECPQMDISIPLSKLVYNGNTVVECADEEIKEIQETGQGNSDKN